MRSAIFIILFGILSGALVFAGGGSDKGSSSGKSRVLSAEELTIGIYNPAGNVTTYSIGNSWNDWILWLVYDKLREPSPYSEVHENWLAESVIPLSEDNKEWQITLKQGILWHDGTELTAEDLVFTYEYYKAGPSNRWTHHVSSVPRMEDIELVDDYTVRVNSEFPMPNFNLITAADLAIIQKKQWEGVTEPKKFMDLPIGTGPYKLVDYKPGEYYILEANDNYFKGMPLVKKLTLVMIQDPQVMFSALKSGEIDGAVRHLPPELKNQWEGDGDVGVIETPSYWGVWMALNNNREPFAVREVRKALCYLINPDSMLETVMINQGLTGTHGYPHPEAPWSAKGQNQPYDPEKAQELFAELGFMDRDGDGYREDPEGRAIDWAITVASNQPLYIRAAEMIKDQLDGGGFKSHLQILDPAAVGTAVWKDLDYDLAVMDITPHGLADQDMFMILNKGFVRRDLNVDHESAHIVDDWFHSSTADHRHEASGAWQAHFNEFPHRILLWYPKGYWAYRPESYDNYDVSPGYGIFHKYSFLPEEARGKTILTNQSQ